MIHWICFGLRVIFKEFLEVFMWFFEKVENYDFQKIHDFELELKNQILIPWSFDFFDILFESKWGVFPYLHLCLK